MGDKCGSMECMDIIDKMGLRLGASLNQQQKDGIRAIKELLISQHNSLADTVKEFKQFVEKDRTEIYDRLRKVEVAAVTDAERERQRIIENDVTVIKSAIGPEGLDTKIAKVALAAGDIRSVRSWRVGWSEGLVMVIGGVLTGLIITWITVGHIMQSDKPSQSSPVATSKAASGR